MQLGRGSIVFWEECQPTDGDFTVGPGCGDTGEKAEDGVIVVFEDSVGADIDGEDGGKKPQPVDNPGFTVGEVALSKSVDSAEESPADATAVGVIDTFLSFADISAAR